MSVHSINRYSFPSSHEITIGFVSSLFGYLMYFVRKQIEMNTNNVIMTKLYGISCHHPCHHLCCCHLCRQLLCRHNKNTFRDIADDIACCLCRGWYTKDELGLVFVGDSWIESS